MKMKTIKIVLVIIATLQSSWAYKLPYVEDAQFWQAYGKIHLLRNLEKVGPSYIKAKNIIIFIGDGMGMTSITAGRIYKGQSQGGAGEEANLVFEDFDNTGMAKTYNVDKQVPDSAGTATAIFSGVKTRYAVVGMDATTSKTNANRGKLTTIMDWAVKAKKRTGFVTTTRITHATPASLYANVYSRSWECDSEIPEESAKVYKDIARQLVEDSPGKNLNVIMGGGLSPMGNLNLNEKSNVNFQGDTETVCKRADGRNLTEDWLNSKPERSRKFVQTREQLLKLDTDNIDHVLGLFRNNHITYSVSRQVGEPTLSEMTEQAIRVLDKPNSEGFVLMVEGGRIDQAHHQNYAMAALQEIVELDTAVETALGLTKKSETLIIVTADHSHSLTLNGYPMRGNDILGFANKTINDMPYETLTYANGPGFFEHLFNGTNKSESRHGIWMKYTNQYDDMRTRPTYRHFAAFYQNDETHGGEDVAVYATGPGSELIRGTFEQNYIAWVMSFAGCMGPAENMNDLCDQKLSVSSSSSGQLVEDEYQNYLIVWIVIATIFLEMEADLIHLNNLL